jgi:GNAT superfamily N-acetyltransferase
VSGAQHPGPVLADLERAAAEHWQAADRAALGEWLLRAAGGFTGRANSALPLGDPGMPLGAAVDAVTAWYRSRDLPAMIVVPRPLAQAGTSAHVSAADVSAAGVSADGASADGPPRVPLDDLLAAREWMIRSGTAVVMTAAIADLPHHGAGTHGAGTRDAGVTVEMASEPGPDWLAIYRYRGQPLPDDALNLLLSAPWQAFATVQHDGQAVAVGRVSVAAGWAGITAVEVAADHRRGGLGTAVTVTLARAAAERGVNRVFLQVEDGNSAARALYARCGFRDAHAYHYRVAPDSGR